MKNFIGILSLLMCISVTGFAQNTSLGFPYLQDIDAIVQRGELRVAIYSFPNLEPFVVMNGTQMTGYDVDLSQKIAQHLGVKLRIDQASSCDEAVSFVASGQDDIAVSNLSITPDRALSVLFTVPYYSMPIVLVAKNNFQIPDQQLNQTTVSTDSSLNIGVEANGAYAYYGQMAFPQATITPYTNINDAMDAVKGNTYDAILVDKFTAQHAIQGEVFLSIYNLDKTHVDSEAIAVNGKEPQLLLWLNAYLTSLQGQAEQASLKKQWRLN